MKTIFALLLGVMFSGQGTAFSAVTAPADPPLGRLPDGKYYIADEVNFALKEPVARALSPVGVGRRAVPVGQLTRLHPAIAQVVAGHTAARLWLAGQPLPQHLVNISPGVPVIARSLKAKLLPGQNAAQVVSSLAQHPDVQWASLIMLHPTTEVPNDTLWGKQWGPKRIRADDAWDVAPASTTRRVAIVDTGVDLTHPDLASRIVYNAGFGDNTDGDAKRDARGGNSIDHGTHVAGIAAAIRDNSRGIAGVARINIMAMGCAVWNSDKNVYQISWAADAINDAVANGADAINCSFSNPELTSDMSDALDTAQAAGVLVIAAAGNEGMDVDSDPDAMGWNEHPYPIIVSNLQSDDTLAPSSNTGTAIDLAAPGTSILSTVTDNYHPANVNGNYDIMSGTSMAAPHVAAATVMVRSMNPSLLGSGSGIKALLFRMADDIGTAGKDTSYGYGVLQLDPVFLRTLRSADGFVDPLADGLFMNGSWGFPYNTLATAVNSEPAGSTIVLNAGTVNQRSFSYPDPITISKACTLTALPDHQVIIGK